MGRDDLRDGRIYPLWGADVPFRREPVHGVARVRLAAAHVQENRVLLRDPDHCLSWFALRRAWLPLVVCTIY